MEKQFDLNLSGHDSQLIDDSIVQLLQSERASSHIIEDLESIKEVEVRMHYELHLGLLNQPLLVDELQKGIKQLLLHLVHDERTVHFFHEIGLLFAGGQGSLQSFA